MQKIDWCRACGSTALENLFSLGTQYVSDFVHDAELPGKEQCPIQLCICRGCDLVQAQYSAGYYLKYWYRSGTNATMRDHLRDAVRDIRSRVDISPGDCVLDIGANDGTMLKHWGSDQVRIGVEPGLNLHDDLRKHCDALVPTLWSYGALQDVAPSIRPKVVTAFGMLYDLEDPFSFLQDVARVLHPGGIFVAQLQCLKQTMQLGDVGNYCHEHLEFYSLRSFMRLLERTGLELFDIDENTCNGGSYRLYMRHMRRAPHFSVSLEAALRFEASCQLTETSTLLRHYAAMDRNRQQVHGFVASKSDVWGYGASTKGNVMLQWYGLKLTAIADRSPWKHGLYTVGTGTPIVSEEEMREKSPEYLLVLPYSFLPEFMLREADLRRRGTKFIVPLPQLRVA